jgi:enamine deaminase RidA (YjgF/YER057c/UK114 family)
VIEVLQAAGGKPADLMSFTIFVTSVAEYKAALKPLGDRYRRRMGRHFPCMALVEVRALVHPRAKVEIQASAVLDA